MYDTDTTSGFRVFFQRRDEDRIERLTPSPPTRPLAIDAVTTLESREDVVQAWYVHPFDVVLLWGIEPMEDAEPWKYEIGISHVGDTEDVFFTRAKAQTLNDANAILECLMRAHGGRHENAPRDAPNAVCHDCKKPAGATYHEQRAIYVLSPHACNSGEPTPYSGNTCPKCSTLRISKGRAVDCLECGARWLPA